MPLRRADHSSKEVFQDWETSRVLSGQGPFMDCRATEEEDDLQYTYTLNETTVCCVHGAELYYAQPTICFYETLFSRRFAIRGRDADHSPPSSAEVKNE
jgi:hypothetical protein